MCSASVVMSCESDRFDLENVTSEHTFSGKETDPFRILRTHAESTLAWMADTFFIVKSLSSSVLIRVFVNIQMLLGNCTVSPVL